GRHGFTWLRSGLRSVKSKIDCGQWRPSCWSHPTATGAVFHANRSVLADRDGDESPATAVAAVCPPAGAVPAQSEARFEGPPSQAANPQPLRSGRCATNKLPCAERRPTHMADVRVHGNKRVAHPRGTARLTKALHRLNRND